MTREKFTSPTRTGAVLGALLIGALAFACREPGSPSAERDRITPTYNQANGRLSQLAYDSDGNGRHDMWAYMDGAALIRLEADENEDGTIDRWEYYPAGSTAADRQPPERIERSTKFDGRVSRREFFSGGTLTRIEEDTDGNQVMDKWETYAAGVLTVLALDTSGRGKPDRRLIYRADGTLERIEVDPAGTGHFQVSRQ